MEINMKQCLEAIRNSLDNLISRMPWVVHPRILKDIKRLGLCTDNFIAADIPLNKRIKTNEPKA
jgi:hypothetical protein